VGNGNEEDGNGRRKDRERNLITVCIIGTRMTTAFREVTVGLRYVEAHQWKGFFVRC